MVSNVSRTRFPQSLFRDLNVGFRAAIRPGWSNHVVACGTWPTHQIAAFLFPGASRQAEPGNRFAGYCQEIAFDLRPMKKPMGAGQARSFSD